MTELVAKTPCEGLLPLKIGAFSLTEEAFAPLVSLMPFKGREEALSAALEAAHGVKLPGAGRSTSKAGTSVLWFGRGQYLLVGAQAAETLGEHGAVVDQSDAWARVRLEGAGVEAVLARLLPVDLRAGVFKRGHTLRSPLEHMMASVTRVGPEAFSIMVFRSMAATLVHDLKSAMEGVAARG
ncbi:MAG: sarcosine oxidase subunit gamma [Pseudooceanicola sp.]|nr:sarcosine oxidase subunit gamma [Pseudooceanicola sp.]